MLRTSLGAAALIALAAAPADARAPRRLVVSYQGTSGVSGVGSVVWRTTEHRVGEAQAPVSKADRTVTVSVTDASGRPVAFSLWQDPPERWGRTKGLGEYCGRTPKAVPLVYRGGTVNVHVVSGACGSEVGVGTSGTVTFLLA